MKSTITYKVAGAAKAQSAEAATIGELKQIANLQNYSASINGESAEDNEKLSDGDFVTFAPAVKGGC